MRLVQEDTRGRTGQSRRMAGPEIREGRRGGRMFASRSGLLRRAAAKRVLQFTGVRDELFNLLGTPNVVRGGGFRLGGCRLESWGIRSGAASRVLFASMVAPQAVRERHGFNAVISVDIRVVWGAREVAGCDAAVAGGPAQSMMLDTNVVWQRSQGGSWRITVGHGSAFVRMSLIDTNVLGEQLEGSSPVVHAAASGIPLRMSTTRSS